MEKEEKEKYIKELYSKTTKVLYDYVLKTIKDYEYEGSPIYDGYIDRETLNQMIDRVLEKAGELDYIEEIVLKESVTSVVDEKMLLRAIIELIIINELFVTSNEEDVKPEEGIINGDSSTRNESMIYYINLFENENLQPIIDEKIEVKQYFGDFL